MARTRTYLALVCLGSTIISPLTVAGLQAKQEKPTDKAQTLQKAAQQAELKVPGGPTRFHTHISTDKPIYRLNEKAYIRGVMLNAANRKPIANETTANAIIEIRGPKGDVVASGTAQTRDSVWSFEWPISESLAGGEYSIKATYREPNYAPAERKFDIRAYRAPRLNSHITFLRDGYGPAEKVTATLEVKRAEGGVPSGATVSVNARVDGVAINSESAKVDDKGLCTVSFDLPREIAKGEGTLALTIQDGGVVETASKTIPILLQTVDIQIFPEGGYLVSGFKNRVYVQANQPNGKPADLEATVVSTINGSIDSTANSTADSKENGTQEKEITKFRTEHEGRGRFEFTPDSRLQYFLKVSKPSGIKKMFPLPKIKLEGAVISTDTDVFKRGQPITLKVGSTSKMFRVSVAKREVELAASKLCTTPNRSSKHPSLKAITLPMPDDTDGVLTATVWDGNGVPLAERLIFREESKPLNISISASKTNYVPGDNAEVKIKATDADGKPVSAVVGVTVTDESILQMVEKREQAPRLPVMVFLEPEVKDLADAHVYLDSKNPKAPMATDLLLGTQGWRRFALIDLRKFISDNGDQGKRVLAVGTPMELAQLARFSGVNSRIVAGRIGERGGKQDAANDDRFNIAANIGRVEGPRDMNMFCVEPTVIDERHFSSGRAERHQKTSPTLPEGAPIPDNDEMPAQRFPFFSDRNVSHHNYGPPFVVVREFAHQVRPDRKPNERTDFKETIYWNAAVKTDATTGEGTINFGLNDSVTTFQVFADGFADGAIGASNLELKAVQPFYAEAKLPLEVTSGDQILLPISLVNGTANALQSADVQVDLPGPFKLLPILQRLQQIASDARVRCIQPITVGFGKGIMNFVLKAKAGSYEDNVTRQITIAPKGFPVEKAFGGILEPGKKAKLQITMENNVVPESVVSNTLVFPSPLANLTGALERMIQEPCGCFEQTSSTSYPLTMAQQYFLSHTGVAPKLIDESRKKLDSGYKMLVGFWCPDKGYEWFGENPGHEALTAFGLMHFTDMAQVRDVDRNMVANTRTWLLKQKDGAGGFSRKRRALHTWIEDKDCSNAYIVWALLETGADISELKAEIESLKTAAANSKNSYVVALAANALYLSGDKTQAKQLMQRLAKLQKSDGAVDKITSSIVGSGGESLEVEGTALAALAWLRDPEFAGNVEKSIKYLADSCKAGRFGSTQATVLALRTIVSYDKQRARPKAPGKLRLYVDGQAIGDWIAFDKSTQESIKLPDLSELLNAGDHTVEIEMADGSPMPYSLAVKYNTLSPANAKDCKLNLAVKMAQDKVIEGASTEANVTVENATKEVVPSPVAIIGLPGGLEPRHDQLKELVKRGTIDAYEVRGREVVLYWRTLPASSKLQLPLSLIAAVPGSYTGPASRAYLYYTDEDKNWVDGLHVEIAAKN